MELIDKALNTAGKVTVWAAELVIGLYLLRVMIYACGFMLGSAFGTFILAYLTYLAVRKYILKKQEA